MIDAWDAATIRLMRFIGLPVEKIAKEIDEPVEVVKAYIVEEDERNRMRFH